MRILQRLRDGPRGVMLSATATLMATAAMAGSHRKAGPVGEALNSLQKPLRGVAQEWGGIIGFLVIMLSVGTAIAMGVSALIGGRLHQGVNITWLMIGITLTTCAGALVSYWGDFWNIGIFAK